MNKVFTLCSAAALLAAGGANAQMSRSNQAPNPCACLEQGMGLPSEKKCFPAAYNAPASISVSCGWDFDVFASFLYWYVGQDSMDVAHIVPTLVNIPGPSNNGSVAYQNQTWKPGFQVGFGFNTGYDDWVGWVEYTWLHQSTSNSQTAPLDSSGGVQSWNITNWAVGAGAGLPNNVVSPSWKMQLDMLDAFFSRPYYQGTQLTVAPYAGLRALWIRQFNTVASGNVVVRANSNSWAIGPACGAEGHWMLGMGFRFEGNATAALLYTQYTKIAYSEVNSTQAKVTATARNVSAVRPVAQLGVGLGWGSYLFCQKHYIDFSARYDFNYFWNQGVNHNYVSNLIGFGNNIGDLYMHGLTLTGRFDF